MVELCFVTEYVAEPAYVPSVAVWQPAQNAASATWSAPWQALHSVCPALIASVTVASVDLWHVSQVSDRAACSVSRRAEWHVPRHVTADVCFAGSKCDPVLSGMAGRAVLARGRTVRVADHAAGPRIPATVVVAEECISDSSSPWQPDAAQASALAGRGVCPATASSCRVAWHAEHARSQGLVKAVNLAEA